MVAAIKRYRYLLCLVALFLIPVAHAGHDDTVPAYKFGVVPQFSAQKIHAIWQPILDELQNGTGLHFTLIGSTNISEFEKKYLNGSFDFAYMNPLHILKAHKSHGYRPLTRDHAQLLQGVLVVRADSPIQSPMELTGKTVAFPSPVALGASLMIRADLQDRFKVNIVPKYVRSHSSVYLNVALGHAIAGGGVQKTLEKQPANVRKRLRILYQTRKVKPHPISVHPRVPETVQKKVLQTLLALGQTSKGRQLLEKIPIKQIGPASLEDYEELSRMGLERFYPKHKLEHQ